MEDIKMKDETKIVLRVVILLLAILIILAVVSFYIAKAFLVGHSPLEVPAAWIAVFSALVLLILIRIAPD